MSASTTSHRLYKAFFIALLLMFALVYLGPLYVMLSTSFKGVEEIRNGNILAVPALVATATALRRIFGIAYVVFCLRCLFLQSLEH